MMAIVDVDKILLTNLDKTSHAMGCQILLPFIHVLLVWSLAIKAEMGTSGIALAFFISYFLVFLIQLLVIKYIEEAKELNKVGFFSMETVTDLKAYMKIALPNVLSMIIEFATFDIMIVMMGIVGVVS